MNMFDVIPFGVATLMVIIALIRDRRKQS